MFRFFTSIALLSLTATVLASPALPPKYGQVAGGTEAQILTSKALSQDGINQLQLTNFLENLEVAFFREGAQNYTQRWKSGGNVNGVKTADVIRRIQAQEVVHKESIEELLKANRAEAVASCKYSFPVTDEKSFLALASIITNIGIGSLINTVGKLSITDAQLEASIASIIPVEARHDAFFRLYNKEVPNPSTFETRISGIWAYNLALDFIQHGSCGNLPQFIRSLPVFPDLQLVGSGMLAPHDVFADTNDSRNTKLCNPQCSWQADFQGRPDEHAATRVRQ
jgi:Ferritin-like domain